MQLSLRPGATLAARTAAPASELDSQAVSLLPHESCTWETAKKRSPVTKTRLPSAKMRSRFNPVTILSPWKTQLPLETRERQMQPSETSVPSVLFSCFVFRGRFVKLAPSMTKPGVSFHASAECSLPELQLGHSGQEAKRILLIVSEGNATSQLASPHTDESPWLLLLSLLAWGHLQPIILPMLPFNNQELRNSSSAFVSTGLFASSPLALSRTSIMEDPNVMAKGNIPQKRKFSCCQVAFYALPFLLTLSFALVPVVLCVLHHKQATGTCWAHGSLNSTLNPEGILTWNWELTHCDGFVQKHSDMVTIMESGNYFIYAQVFRKSVMNESFSLALNKMPDILLSKVVGPNNGDDKATINFGRPFSLQKGDRLYCQINFTVKYILAENLTYWGLYKM